MRIAALDDEPRQIEAIGRAMEAIGHECHGFTEGKLLTRELRQQSFDLLILDWGLPGLEGLGVVKWVRDQLSSRLPVLFLAEPGQKDDMVGALTAGADDFIVRPVQANELQARVHALLRRSYPALYETVLNVGPYRFSLTSRTVEFRGEPVDLKYREYDLALFMFQNVGRLLSREHLLEAVWGTGAEGSSRSLDTHMSRLRTKLDVRPANGLLLSAVYGLGYRLELVHRDAASQQQQPSVSMAL